MRPFQRHAKADLERLADLHGIRLDFEVVECKPDPSLGHEEGDVYLRTQFERAARHYDVYLYTDEASLSVEGEWLMFEVPDYQNDENRLRATVIDFIRLSLDGWDVDRALAEARKYCGTAS